MNQITSMREMQRNYRTLINRVKRTKKPLFLGAHQKPEAVLLDIEAFESLNDTARDTHIRWSDLKQKLAWIRQGGETEVSLSDFIHADRTRH